MIYVTNFTFVSLCFYKKTNMSFILDKIITITDNIKNLEACILQVRKRLNKN